MVVKVVFVLFILILLLFAVTRYILNSDKSSKDKQLRIKSQEEIIIADYLPVGGDEGELVLNKFFTLSYNEEHEQPNWVAYELLAEQLNRPGISREDLYFYADERVTTKTADWFDYKETSYTRGHLVPAGDRAWSEDAMKETFLMSNISPQTSQFNGGIWRELEENVRNWAREMGHLYIVSGPVLDDCSKGTIGQTTNITIPCRFYKAILHIDDEGTGHYIGYLIPNEMSTRPLNDYVVTIDSLEDILDIDLFRGLVPNEAEGEAYIQPGKWTVDSNKFKTRLNNWNKK